MAPPCTLGYLLLAITAGASVTSALADSCTFTPECDYARGSRDSGPATTQEACCTLCQNRSGCAAGVFDGTKCWFKTAQDVKGGCKTSARVKASCVPKGIRPGPSPPPGPGPSPGPSPPGPAKPIVPPSPAPKCAPGSNPVQVFILMGQSNMLGEGHIGNLSKPTPGTLASAVLNGSYSYLYDKTTKNWTTSKTVRNVFIMNTGGPISPYPDKIMTDEWMMGPNRRGSIGPELGIGGMLEGANPTTPYMMLKSCIGDRALGWDLLPPGTKRSNFTQANGDVTSYAGYHDSPMSWAANKPKPPEMGWYAGEQYDGDISRANEVLANLSWWYPSTPPKTCYEVAGFFWWQGDKDSRDIGLSTHYEQNLVALIKQLRVQYDAPNAKFVTATLGQTVMPNVTSSGAGEAQASRPGTPGGTLILEAMLNVANGTKYPAFKGNVAAIYTHPLMDGGGSSSSHYGGNPKTYMNVGEAMGTAMVKMLIADQFK